MALAGASIVKGVSSMFGANAAHNDKIKQIRAQNQAKVDAYKQQLQIRDLNWKQTQSIYGQKLAQYDQQMTAADRAASRAYGIEQYNRSQRLKQSAVQSASLDRALAQSGGSAAAAGKSGRSAELIDTNIESNYVRNQNMIAQNLLTAEETRQYRELGIADKFDSFRNNAYSKVAIAPTAPIAPMKPRQLSGPSTTGRNLQMLNAGLGMAQGIAGAFPPASGGGGGDELDLDLVNKYSQ